MSLSTTSCERLGLSLIFAEIPTLFALQLCIDLIIESPDRHCSVVIIISMIVFVVYVLRFFFINLFIN